MNNESIAQACFVEVYVVPSQRTARSPFAQLPPALAYADTLSESIAADYLIAVVESTCIKEMQRHIDPTIETVVGRSMRLEHCGPIPSGAAVLMMGWCEQLGQRSATFRVHVFDEHALVCDGQVTLVAADHHQQRPAV